MRTIYRASWTDAQELEGVISLLADHLAPKPLSNPVLAAHLPATV